MAQKDTAQDNELCDQNLAYPTPGAAQGAIMRCTDLGNPSFEHGDHGSGPHFDPQPEPLSADGPQQRAILDWMSIQPSCEGRETTATQLPAEGDRLYQYPKHRLSGSQNSLGSCVSIQGSGISNSEPVPSASFTLGPQPTADRGETVITFHRNGQPLGTPISPGTADVNRSPKHSGSESVVRSPHIKLHHYHAHARKSPLALSASPLPTNLHHDQHGSAFTPTSTPGPWLGQHSTGAILHPIKHQNGSDATETASQACSSTQTTEADSQSTQFIGSSGTISAGSPEQPSLPESCPKMLDPAVVLEVLNSITDIETQCLKVRALLTNVNRFPNGSGPSA